MVSLRSKFVGELAASGLNRVRNQFSFLEPITAVLNHVHGNVIDPQFMQILTWFKCCILGSYINRLHLTEMVEGVG